MNADHAKRACLTHLAAFHVCSKHNGRFVRTPRTPPVYGPAMAVLSYHHPGGLPSGLGLCYPIHICTLAQPTHMYSCMHAYMHTSATNMLLFQCQCCNIMSSINTGKGSLIVVAKTFIIFKELIG